MKINLFFIPLILLFIPNCFGQEKPEPILATESFGRQCSEELMNRYDIFLTEVYNQANSIGYIIFYGDKSLEGRNLNYITYLTQIYPQYRGYDKSKIVLLRGENQDEMKIQFWAVPPAATPPKPEKDFVKAKITSTTRFDRTWADFNKWSGKRDIYFNGFLELGCDFSPNVSTFAKTLSLNPELTGYLIVYTEFGKGTKHGNQVVNFALKDLIQNHKVPRNRLKAIYGGNRKNPEIELWFVPKGDLPPKITPDKNPEK